MNEINLTQDVSLLWPQDLKRPTARMNTAWLERGAADLGLDDVARALSIDPRYIDGIRNILSALCSDSRTIRYRHEIIADLLNNPSLAAGLESMLPQLLQLSFASQAQNPRHGLLQQTVWRLGELEIYVDCVRRLNASLSHASADLRSEGLCCLRDLLAAREADEDFQTLAAELPSLGAEIRSIRSVAIGINLDAQLLPIEATLLSVHARKFRGASDSLLSKLLGRKARDDEYQGIAQLHGASVDTPPTGVPNAFSPLLVPLLRDLNDVLEATAKPVAAALSRYIKIQGRFLTALEPEIAFYLGAVKLIQQIHASRLPLCQPEVAPREQRICEVQDIYNLNLALRLLARHPGADLSMRMVTNDVNFGPAGRIFILTGPNQGGKTTYTQAIGLAHVLCQAGLYVPGKSARISPVDGIYSHFPREEKPSLEAGRLGEEARRLSEVFSHATRYSLVLMNESLSSTSPGESLYLARDVVRALKLLGARAVFTTHLHELAEDLEAINAGTPGDSNVVSLVALTIKGDDRTACSSGAAATGMTDKSDSAVRRTYKIVPGPPMGLSYARDIARQYGISFEQLQKTLLDREEVD